MKKTFEEMIQQAETIPGFREHLEKNIERNEKLAIVKTNDHIGVYGIIFHWQHLKNYGPIATIGVFQDGKYAEKYYEIRDLNDNYIKILVSPIISVYAYQGLQGNNRIIGPSKFRPRDFKRALNRTYNI
jgi:hypothetical protein